MRMFKGYNQHGKDVCPICKKNTDKPVVLICKMGTQKGNIAEAIQVHLECLDLWYDEEHGMIYQRVGEEK